MSLRRDPSKNFLKLGSAMIVTNLEYVKYHRMIPFFIVMCEKNYSYSSHVSRHADSKSHQSNIRENVICSENDNVHVQEKKARKRNFRQQWLDIEDFKFWLREEPNDANLFYCLICDRSFAAISLSHI